MVTRSSKYFNIDVGTSFLGIEAFDVIETAVNKYQKRLAGTNVSDLRSGGGDFKTVTKPLIFLEGEKRK